MEEIPLGQQALHTADSIQSEAEWEGRRVVAFIIGGGGGGQSRQQVD